jgi:hypothetical protein
MISFLEKTSEFIYSKFGNELKDVCVVLPGKRGSLYLKKNIAKKYNTSLFLPRFCTAEELICEIAKVQISDEIVLLSELFESYQNTQKEKIESFESFSKWGTQILQDFNEIDRFLVDADALFTNVIDAKRIESWNPEGTPPGEFQLKYITFIENLRPLYSDFTNKLLKNGKAYQGLAYRIASENVNAYAQKLPYKKIIFCGFSALNKAEEKIFEVLNNHGCSESIWDYDLYYTSDQAQEAGKFLRNYTSKKWFGTNGFSEDLLKNEKKEIEIIAAAKSLGQAFAAAEVLSTITNEKNLSGTALVLADEKLLFPVLSVLPKTIQSYNITLEYPIRNSHVYGMFESFFHLHAQKSKNGARGFYIHDILSLLQNPLISTCINLEGNKNSLIRSLTKRNFSYFTEAELLQSFHGFFQEFENIFSPWKNDTIIFESIFALLNYVRKININEHPQLQLEMEFLHFVFEKCIQAKQLSKRYAFLNGAANIQSLLMQLLRNESLPFFGEPLQGLQIMGMLETRTLDFENIILLSVNERILPGGKKQNSFIPNDIKAAFEMPLYSDKDAIYAYHFYRLLQRAKKITLIYNSESDTLGNGEKSRFVQQLLLEYKKKNTNADIIERTFTLNRNVSEPEENLQFTSNAELVRNFIERINSPESTGISPTAFNTLRTCQLRFYYRYLLQIKETGETEEEIEAGTLGSIVHRALEKLFEPMKGKLITHNLLKLAEEKKETIIEEAFLEVYSKKSVNRGKNLLARQMSSEFVQKIIDYEKSEINNGYKSSVEELESKITTEVMLDNIPIKIGGKCDRIDSGHNFFRIIDYKSKIKSSDKFKFKNLNQLLNGKKFDKGFQVMLYAWILYKSKKIVPEKIESILLPFQNAFVKPAYLYHENNKLVYSTEIFNDFEQEILKLLRFITHENSVFHATDEPKNCEYCPYKLICRK